MPRDLLAEQPQQPDLPAEQPQQRDLLAGQPQQPYSGHILPFTRDAQGNVRFDPGAGVLEPTARVGEMIQGKLDPMSQEGIEAAARLGTYGLGVPPGMRSAEGLFGAPLRGPPAAPTAEALKAAARTGYDRAKGMRVDFHADAIADMARRLRAELIEGSTTAHIAPKVFEHLDELANPPVGAVSQLSDLIAVRKAFRDARLDFTHPEQRAAAEKVIAEIDGFIEGANPSAVRSDPAVAAEAGQIYKDANANLAAAKRSERLTGTAEDRAERKPGILPRAESRAGATHSGANLDNLIRQRVDELLANPKLSAGFSAEERRQLESVAQGSRPRNLTRRVANLLGGGGGLGSLITGSVGSGIGAALFPASPWVGAAIGGTAAPATGMALKSVQNTMGKRALQAVDEAVRTRSPLYEALVKAMNKLSPPHVNQGRYNSLGRALLGTQLPIPPTEPYSPYRT